MTVEPLLSLSLLTLAFDSTCTVAEASEGVPHGVMGLEERPLAAGGLHSVSTACPSRLEHRRKPCKFQNRGHRRGACQINQICNWMVKRQLSVYSLLGFSILKDTWMFFLPL